MGEGEVGERGIFLDVNVPFRQATQKQKEIAEDISYGRHDWRFGLVPLDRLRATQEHVSVGILVDLRAVKRRSELPEIVVIRVGDVYLIWDGHHRSTVAKELGRKRIRALIVPRRPLRARRLR